MIVELKAIVKDVYQNCLNAIEKAIESPVNYVKEIYKPFSDEEISYKISEILKTNDINAEIEVIFQTIDGLKKLVPKTRGLVFFRDYPTPGGCRVVNNAVNFVEKQKSLLVFYLTIINR